MDAIGSISSCSSSSQKISFHSSEGEESKQSPLKEKITIKDNGNGSYRVITTHGNKVVKAETVNKNELKSKYSKECGEQGIDTQGTNSAEEAQQKYGAHVANHFFALG